jgi:hypothetical protein
MNVPIIITTGNPYPIGKRETAVTYAKLYKSRDFGTSNPHQHAKH